MKHYLITGLFAAVLLSGCSNDTYKGDDRAGARLILSGTINKEMSRVTSSGLSSIWDNGDSIGLYTVNNGTDFANVKYTTDGSGSFKAADGDTYLLADGLVTLNAYYPFKASEELSDGVFAFSVTDESGTYAASDFMFASTAVARGDEAETQATLQFSHKMNRLVLNLKSEDPDFTAEEGETLTYTLQDIKTGGTFNTTTGTITPDGTTGKVVFTGLYGSPAQVLYIPQVKTDTELLIKIGKKYITATLPSLAASEDESGYSYTYNITKTRNGVIVSLVNTGINDWNAGEGGDIEAEEKKQETAGKPSVNDWNNGGNIDMSEQNESEK